MLSSFLKILSLVIILANSVNAQFTFTGFANHDSLNLILNTSILGNDLRLTQPLTNQGGACWYVYQQDVANSFQTEFEFVISNRGGLGGGADGLAFVIQNNSNSIIGTVGSGNGYNIAYGGIGNSIAIEFDTYDNGSDPNNNHVSIQSRGPLPNNPDLIYSLGWSTAIPVFTDGQIHRTKITYAFDTIRVYLDDYFSPVIKARVNLDSLLSLNSNHAWVGFTAATGNGYENHFILNWSFDTTIDTSYPGITPTIIVPGIMGSPLYNNNSDANHLTGDERIWIDATKLLGSDDYLNVLSLNTNGDGPADDADIIVKSPLFNDASRSISNELNWRPLLNFRPFVNYLVNNGRHLDDFNSTHENTENLFFYTYDWRKSIAVCGDSLGYFIDSVLKWTGAPQVNLVTHSMGGLVAKQYIHHTGTTKVKKIIFVGTPHLGSPKLEKVLFNGIPFNTFDYLTDNATYKSISRNMPSTYSLMPSENYFNYNISNSISTGVGLYKYCFGYINGAGISLLDYDATKIFFQNASWPAPQAEFNSQLINTAYNTHDDLADVNFGDIEVYNMAGYGLFTPSQITFTGETKLRDRVISNDFFTGDETVPLRSAEIVNTSLTKANYYIRGVEHSNLFMPISVQELIRRILEEPSDTAGFIADDISTSPPASYIQDGLVCRVGSPVAIHAYDNLGNHTGPTDDSTWEMKIPGSYYLGGELSNPHSTKSIGLTSAGEYTFLIQSLDTTANFYLQIQSLQGGVVLENQVYDSIPTSPNFQGKMLINGASVSAFLSIDNDGDDVFEAKAWPNYTQLTQNVSEGWNLLSLPIGANAASKDVYNNSLSNPFVFQSGYQTTDTLQPGIGYWVKFDSNQSISFYGKALSIDTVEVTMGWNILGGLSGPVFTNSITSIPPGIITTSFFEFNNGYQASDSLKPGQGYWVKVSQAGKIILHAE